MPTEDPQNVVVKAVPSALYSSTIAHAQLDVGLNSKCQKVIAARATRKAGACNSISSRHPCSVSDSGRHTDDWLWSSDRECCHESDSPVRDEVERVSDDLVLVVHPKHVIVERIRTPTNRHVAIRPIEIE